MITTTNAYRLFLNRSCPLKTHCPMFNKFLEEYVDDGILSNQSDITEHCFLCLDILHRYVSDEFIQQVR